MTLEEKFTLLKQEIESASSIAREYYDSDDFSNKVKEDGSPVTAVDTAVETALRTFLSTHFPDDTVIGEEEETTEGTSGFVWHIDPIDGTDNFLRKIPFCSVSVARLGDTTEGSFALVYNPITKHWFTCVEGGQAYENTRLVTLTPEGMGGRFMISVDRGREPWMYQSAAKLLASLEKFGKGVRFGSTALNLAYVAAGRFDALVTFGLSTYDYAAGLYLIKAAGGTISVFENGAWHEWTGSIKELCLEQSRTIFTSHPDVHQMFLEHIGNPRDWADRTLE